MCWELRWFIWKNSFPLNISKYLDFGRNFVRKGNDWTSYGEYFGWGYKTLGSQSRESWDKGSKYFYNSNIFFMEDNAHRMWEFQFSCREPWQLKLKLLEKLEPRWWLLRENRRRHCIWRKLLWCWRSLHQLFNWDIYRSISSNWKIKIICLHNIQQESYKI